MSARPSKRKAKYSKKGKQYLYLNTREKRTLLHLYHTYGNQSKVARKMNIDHTTVGYWVRKFYDPSFHNKPHGGDKRSVFKVYEYPTIFQEVKEYMLEHPKASLSDLNVHICLFFQRHIKKSAFSYLLKKLGWSFKVPVRFQIYKYNLSNIIYYIDYLDVISTFPWNQLKFVDEAHVVSRELVQKRVLGLIGKRTYVRESTLHDSSASITILTKCGDPKTPIVWDMREDSNTQWDFCDFVYFCCKEGHLFAGDYLIADNASVHSGYESADILNEICNFFGVSVVALLAYSPELNPVEKVFSKMKTLLRNHRDYSKNLKDEVALALANISPENIQTWYQNCIFPKTVLPELLYPK
jgi:transposase